MGNPKASAGLKDGDNVIVSPNGDIENGSGETIFSAPKGVSQYSGLFRENEMIYRVNNAGTVTAEYSRAASNTIVNFYKVDEKDSSGNTKFTWIEKQGFTNVKDVSK